MREKKSIILLLLIILLLAAGLRFTNLESTAFEGDQARDFSRIKDIVEGKEFHITGITQSSGFGASTLGPFSYYLLAIPALFSLSPVAISAFIALLNVLAVLLCYKFGKDFFGVKTGLISAALFAVAPWAVFYSKFMWNPNLLPLFVLLFFYAIFSIAIKNKQIYWILALFSFACLLQIHISTLAFTPILFFSLFRKDLNLKFVGIGIVIFLLIFSPFIYFNLTNNFQGIRDIAGYPYVSEHQPLAENTIESVGIPIMLTTSYFGEYILGDSPVFSNLQNILFLSVSIISILLFLIGFTIVCKKSLRIGELKYRKYLLLLLWLIIPVLFFMIRMRAVAPHYFVLLFPAQFIVMGIFLSKIFKLRLSKKIIAIGILLILVVSQIVFSVTFYNFVSDEGGTTGLYGISYDTKENVAKYVLEQSADPKIIFYKQTDRDMRTVFLLFSENIDMKQVNSLNELKSNKGAYLVLDRYSMYGIKSKLTEEEENYFDQLDKTNIGKMEVIKL